VSDWKHARVNDSQKLAQLLFFLMKKTQPGGEAYFMNTVNEIAAPPQGRYVPFLLKSTSHSIKNPPRLFLRAGVNRCSARFLIVCA
jgi:hypothetical protein